jgi:hypothetical protein
MFPIPNRASPSIRGSAPPGLESLRVGQYMAIQNLVDAPTAVIYYVAAGVRPARGLNLVNDYGPRIFDRRQVFALNYVLNVPGMKAANRLSRAVTTVGRYRA